jgi:acyl-CoA thioesterase-1
LRHCALLALLLLGSAAGTAETSNLLVLGDSLSAAYGIPRDRGWVALLQQKLPNFHVVNAGISGDTTDGGVARLPALLQKHQPAIVIVELGGNDGLRGFQIPRIRDNLEQMIRLCQKANAKVLLLGMKIPPNYGLRYTSEFYANYTDTAKKYAVPLVPFFLEGVAAHPDLIQDDGIHPREEAQQKLLNNVWPYLQPLL